MKPKVIVLNGPSSSGKSTLSSALQAALELEDRRYEALSIDDYLPMAVGKVIYEEAVFESCQGLADAAAQIAGRAAA